MKLSKQLLIVISALFLMIFSVNFVLSVNNIRSYLENEAEVHAQDTATSLGLSLSPYMVDEQDPVLRTMMNAIFDRGYYKEIILLDVEGLTLVELQNDDRIEGVPDWFVDMFPMRAASADSEISTGWNIVGTLTVAINPGYGYLKLYQQVKQTLLFSLLAFVVSVGLLLVILQITLSSLNRIGELAETIASGSFEKIESLPWTTEVRKVAASMNIMSQKLEKVIGNLNTKLEQLGSKLQRDELTGLRKKSGFDLDIKEVISSHVESYLLIVKVDALSQLVKELGDETIDQFLKDVADLLNEVSGASQSMDVSVYRFVGSEFALLARHADHQKAQDLAQQLTEAFSTLAAKYERSDIAHIGVAPFDFFNPAEHTLLAAHEAYEQAQLVGANSYSLREGEDRAKDIAEWKALVFDVVDQQAYDVSYISPVLSFENGQPIMEEAFSVVSDAEEQPISIATFVSIAEKFVKIVEFDQGVLKEVLERLSSSASAHKVAINLSIRTIKNSDFRLWLSKQLQANPQLANKLVFSLSAYAVAKEENTHKEFINFVHQHGAQVMIKRFEAQLLSPETVKNLKPDYIRLARNIGSGVSQNSSKQDFVRTMVELGELLEIKVLAEDVLKQADFDVLKMMGVTGASRK